MPFPQRFSAQVNNVCLWLALAFAFLAVTQIRGHEPGTPEEKHALLEFNAGLHNYFQIHRLATEKLGQAFQFKVADSGEDIVQREHVLAREISELRQNAMEGELFTPAVKAYFAERLDSAYRSNPLAISASLACVSEIVEEKLNPNSVYPEDWGYNMMPPTLLLAITELPEDLEYQIVNRDMIIRDVDSNLVVDVMRNAITFPLEGAQCDE
jgi:hypothetical protein